MAVLGVLLWLLREAVVGELSRENEVTAPSWNPAASGQDGLSDFRTSQANASDGASGRLIQGGSSFSAM